MAVNRTTNSDPQAAEQPKKVVSRKSSGKTAAPAKSASAAKTRKLEEEAERAKVLKDIGEGIAKSFNEELGVDLKAMPLSDLYNIKNGKPTDADYRMLISPLVYSSERKAEIRMEPVEVYGRLHVDQFPYVKDGKSHPLRVSAIPALPLVEREPSVPLPVGKEAEELAAKRFMEYQYDSDPYVQVRSIADLKKAYGTDKEVPVSYVLESQVEADRAKGDLPYVQVGSVSYDDYVKLVAEKAVPERKFMEYKDFKPEFTDEEVMQLSRAGVNSNRLYNAPDRLSKEQKMDLYFGEEVLLQGYLKTGIGDIRVAGGVSLVDDDGAVKSEFSSMRPSPLNKSEKKDNGLVVDLAEARFVYDSFGAHNGDVIELELFKRGQDGRLLVGEDGRFIPNEAGVNLMDFRSAGQAVDFKYHTRRYDKSTKSNVEAVRYGRAIVSVENDNLHFKRVGQLVEKRSELEDVNIGGHVKDNTVRKDGGNEALVFKDDNEKARFLRGGFAVVTNATFKDYSGKMTIPYEAVVVATPEGYAHQYGIENSNILRERLRPVQKLEKQEKNGRRKPVRRFGGV